LSASGAFSANLATVLTKNLLAGTYKFKYFVAGVAPCTSDEETITVIIRANPMADAGQNKELDCFGTTLVLGGSGTTGGANVSYFWEKDGQEILLANDKNLSANKTGIYTLKVVESPLGCKDSDDVLVTQAVAAAAIFPKTTPNLCFGQTIATISLDSISGGAAPFLYSLNGSPFSNVHFWTNLGAGTFEVKIQDVKGCEFADSVEIAAPLKLTVDLGADTLIELGENLTVFATILSPQAAIDTLIWSPVFDTTHVGLPEQSLLPFASQLLTLTVIDSNGCRAVDHILIEVDKTRHVYVPNSFAPNTNENGRFTVYGGRDVAKIKSFKVFDRWGEMVFENKNFDPNDPTIGWDGQFLGKKLTSAVFVWWAEILFIDGTLKLYKGDLTLEK
jgi:gliding motility-associated-like protein